MSTTPNMRNNLGKMHTVLTLACAMLLPLSFAGCKSSPSPAAPAPAQGVQGTMSPNGTFTPAPGQTAPQPAPANSSAALAPATATSPAAPAPAPQAAVATPPPPPAAPVVRSLPAETPIPVRITETLAASKNDVGDRFTGVIAADVISHGETFYARGTPVSGEVVAAKGRGKFKGAGDLAIQLTAIGRQSVNTSEYEVVGKGKGKRTAGFIGGGAGVGALIGGLAGGGKGAAIGALAGAGGGTAAGAYTGNKDVVIASESLVRFRLLSPVTR